MKKTTGIIKDKIHLSINGIRRVDVPELPKNLWIKKVTANILNLLRKCDDLQGAQEISIHLCSDSVIQEFNLKFRGKASPTDVLSFPMNYGVSDNAGNEEFVFPQVSNRSLLGDVVLSIPTAIKQSKEIGHTLNDELIRLLIHAVLHLVGYDHECSVKEKRRMEKKEDELALMLLNLHL